MSTYEEICDRYTYVDCPERQVSVATWYILYIVLSAPFRTTMSLGR